MSDVSAPPTPGGAIQPSQRERRSWTRRAVIWALVAAASYGLILFLLNDTFYWLAVPGLFGLLFVVIMAVQSTLHHPVRSAVRYATGSTDARRSVRDHYGTVLKRPGG